MTWRIIQSMYKEVRSRVKVGDEYSSSYDVRMGVYQGPVFSMLHFITFITLLSLVFCLGCF